MAEYYQQTIEETLKTLDTDAAQGLSDAEVSKRQATHGKNSLPVEEGTNWLQLVIDQFKDLMVIILIAAAVISALLGDSKDVIVILAIVILNAIIGTYQEFQAEKALAALSAMQVPMVRVRRKGEVDQISAEDLVPGDIVLLNEGDRIPADGRLIENINMQIDESALTGESMPVNKKLDALPADQTVTVGDRDNMTFMGTAVTYGRGEMVITQTGLKTELGNIAAMLLQVEQGITPLQRRLNDLSKILAIGAGIVVVIVFIAGVLRGIPVQNMFLTSISLAVAAVPEGLPALITISLSLGAARMVRRHALIRRLPAVETLGSVTVICSDKTGTLTKNEMTATRIALPGMNDISISGIGYTPEGKFTMHNGESHDPLEVKANQPVKRFVTAIALSTNAHLQDGDREGTFTVMGDTTEGALIVAAQKIGWTRQQLEKDLPRESELPFSSERKAMTTIHKVDSTDAKELFPGTPFVAITKGAPDQLLEWAAAEMTPNGTQPLTPERRNAYSQQTDKMAQQGLRVLGIAYRPLDLIPAEVTTEIERELTILGLVGIVDPARPEAREAVATARTAGIRPVMITGDHALTAEAIATDLGILKANEKAVTGAQLDKLSENELKEVIKETSVFARVSPQHKLQLVRALQQQDQIVAMTGDGVNDAPALKQADIGVAMGITGTDVSKGAAAMVLTDDNFASIVAAVEEGRVIYDNIRKFIKYLLSSNVAEILVMFLALIAGLKIPLLAIQILWINLVTDGLPAIALGFEPAEEGVMRRKPRPTTDSVFAGGLGIHIIWASILLTAITLGGYLYGYADHHLNPLSSTLALEYMNTAELATFIDAPTLSALIPADWDSLSLDEHRALISEHEQDEASGEHGSGGLIGAAEQSPRTIAFTVLALGQIFHVIAIHAGDKESFFQNWFSKNRLLLYACISTFLLQLGVIYIPILRQTFETTTLDISHLLITIGLAALMFVGVEIEKALRRNGVIKFAA
ncbi:MAG: cation-translocating P-type ATPase [Chloroflexi bacterium]|nr:cation-translocating P-type ATPase [Chloroflexota bacterium]